MTVGKITDLGKPAESALREWGRRMCGLAPESTPLAAPDAAGMERETSLRHLMRRLVAKVERLEAEIQSLRRIVELRDETPKNSTYFACHHPETGEIMGREYFVDERWCHDFIKQDEMPGLRLGRMPVPAFNLEWDRRPRTEVSR